MKKIIESLEGDLERHYRVHQYLCDRCGAEVYSLICRQIEGRNHDICSLCYEKESYLKSSNYPGQPHREEVKE